LHAREALSFWADLIVDPCTSAPKRALYYLMGGLASLAILENRWKTGLIFELALTFTTVQRFGGGAIIRIGARGFNHVMARHFPGGAQTAGKSLFNAGETIPRLVRAAERMAPVAQSGGNFERIIQAGRAIGVDRATGLPTSTYTVIPDRAGNLVTMFPGVP
jgi:hypothetical protein